MNTVNLKVSKRENGLGLGSDGIDGAGNRGWSETGKLYIHHYHYYHYNHYQLHHLMKYLMC